MLLVAHCTHQVRRVSVPSLLRLRIYALLTLYRSRKLRGRRFQAATGSLICLVDWDIIEDFQVGHSLKNQIDVGLLEETDLQVFEIGHKQVDLVDHGLHVCDWVIADVKRSYLWEFASELVGPTELLYETLAHKNANVVRAEINDLYLRILL